jgi:enolase-phosphatase E1
MDVEGTTSSISFVHDVMFPFARNNVATFLESNWKSTDLEECLDQLAVDAGKTDRRSWLDGTSDEGQQNRVVEAVHGLMDGDAKVTGLKQLQGMIWKSGFESGELVSHVYPEVANCLRAWREAGLDLRIYSSGSIQAQKLFFAHTVAGNLLPLLTAHYDTTSGGKKEAASYRTIAWEIDIEPKQVVFLSDIPAELDAAAESGMQTILSVRPGNTPVADSPHRKIHSFESLAIHRTSGFPA